MMSRHRRFDSWREWGRDVRVVVLRERSSLSAGRQRRVLRQLTALLVLSVGLPGALLVGLSWRRDAARGDGSPEAWERAVTRGRPLDRADRVMALGEHPMVLRVSCKVLSGLLRDSSVVRIAAVPTVAGALRGGRCRDEVLQALAQAPEGAAREGAALALGGGGPAVLGYAIAPLMRVVESDPAARTAAIRSLALLGDTSFAVRDVMVHAFRAGPGESRVEALDALERLGHPADQLSALAREALHDSDPATRAAARAMIDRWRGRPVSR